MKSTLLRNDILNVKILLIEKLPITINLTISEIIIIIMIL